MSLPKKYTFFFLLLIFSVSLFKAQDRALDSIRHLIAIARHDTTRAQNYVALTEILAVSSVDSIIPLCLKAIEIADNNAANTNKQQHLAFQRAKALAINNIGYVYVFKGNNALGLEYYFKGLDIREEIGDVYGISESMYNIASIYRSQNNLPKALEYMQKSIKLSEEKNNKKSMALAYYGIGTIFLRQNKTKEAMDYYQKSLKLNKELKIDLQVGRNLSSIGSVYVKENNFEEALKYFSMGLTLSTEINDRSNITSNYISIGNIYFKQNKLPQALDYGSRAMELGKKIGYPDRIRAAAKLLSDIYTKQNDKARAFDMYKLFIQMRDSISNQESQKDALQKQFQYEYDKKAAADSVRIADEKKVTDAHTKQEKTQRYALFGGLVLVLIFALIMLQRFRISQKQKGLIEHQKELVEEKQKEILDSINYAKKIQQAVLKDEEHVSKHLPPHFIFFKPKDIVSGDFYWALEKNDYLYFAAADCTGHGVPGAFLTLLGASFLNEINAKESILNPGEILDDLRNKMVKELGMSGHTKDGMDISLLRLNLKTKELMWAGAYNPLWYVQDGKLKEIKANKQPIGYSEQHTVFTNHTLNLKPNDTVFLFTDGFADQFGGPRGKKFKYKKLEELLMANYLLPVEEQKKIVRDTFKNWRGDFDQVDDVLVIGIRI